jgi:hypothetical protein
LQRNLHDSIEKCLKGETCVAPPLASTQAYYAHLSRMPVPVAWSPEFAGLLAALQRAQSAVNTYNQTHQAYIALSQQIGMAPGQDPTCYQRNNFNHTYLKPQLSGERKARV